MAHFARVEGGLVQQVIVVNNNVIQDDDGNEQESLGLAFCQSLYGADTTWAQTSYNATFRKNFAGIYDTSRDAFIAPQPFASWVLNETTCRWEAPTPYPTDGQDYIWDEANLSWTLSNS